MDELTAEAMQRRLDHLERENRRVKRIALVAAALTLVSLLHLAVPVGTAQVRTIEAERFVLRDRSGVVRAQLSISPPSGAAELSFNDEEGRALISMPGAGGFASIVLSGANGSQRAVFSSGRDHFGVDHGASLTLSDTNGNLVWAAP